MPPRLPITYYFVKHSFWNFAQGTGGILSCSVYNFKAIGQLKLYVMDERDFARFEFKMSLGRISSQYFSWLTYIQIRFHKTIQLMKNVTVSEYNKLCVMILKGVHTSVIMLGLFPSMSVYNKHFSLRNTEMLYGYIHLTRRAGSVSK